VLFCHVFRPQSSSTSRFTARRFAPLRSTWTRGSRHATCSRRPRPS
jgi:hypothetical protein